MSPDILVLEMYLHRLSVSESEEWVCTKTVFPNASTLRACEKTYTGITKFNHKSCYALFHVFSTCIWCLQISQRKHFRRREVLKLFLQQLATDPPSLPLLFRVLQLSPPIPLLTPAFAYHLYLHTPPHFGAICSIPFP